tara:strand:+ start:391 stop:1011 length:621 start_codon:yes stop_codon:yes gene_type:complete
VKFYRNKLLLSEKNKIRTSIGYARAIDGEIDYLNKQIQHLKNYGCKIIFSEIVSLNDDNKPQLKRAFESLSRGDQLVLYKLDRAFKSKDECIKIINKLLDKGINLKTLSGVLETSISNKLLRSIFKVLLELDNLEIDFLSEKKVETLKNRKIVAGNLGGRPRISPLKENLVVRLRNDGFSYRSIRAQTGIALSTIRRILMEYELSK